MPFSESKHKIKFEKKPLIGGSPLSDHMPKKTWRQPEKCRQLAVMERWLSNRLPDLQFLHQQHGAGAAHSIHSSLWVQAPGQVPHCSIYVNCRQSLRRLPSRQGSVCPIRIFCTDCSSRLCDYCIKPPLSAGCSHQHPTLRAIPTILAATSAFPLTHCLILTESFC